MRRMVVTTLAVPLLLARTLAAQEPADGMHAVTTPLYELRAADAEALREAQEELDFAVAQWRRYFGADPAPIAVVVFDDVAQAASVDASDYAARGMRLLPWFSREALARLDERAAAARPLSHEACHVFLHSHVERIRGRPTADPGARARFSGHYGHPELADWVDEAVATLCEFPEQRARREQEMVESIEGRIPLAELFTMTHPLMQGRAGTAAIAVPTGSGSPVALDSAALAAIQAALQGGRDTTITIGGRQGRITVRAPNGDPDAPPARRMVSSAVLPATALDPEVMARARTFYAQVLSLATFMAEREGDRFVGRLVDALATQRSVEESLQAASALPRELGALEREWLAWAAARRGR